MSEATKTCNTRRLKRRFCICTACLLVLLTILFDHITLNNFQNERKLLRPGYLNLENLGNTSKGFLRSRPTVATRLFRSKSIQKIIPTREFQMEDDRWKQIPKRQVPVKQISKKGREFVPHVQNSRLKTRGRQEREYTVLFYNPKYYETYHLSDDFAKPCKYSNCKFVHNKTNVANVDAVIIEGVELNIDPPVERKKRRPDQMWIMFGQESPVHYFEDKLHLSQWRDVFNWTMTYHGDADFSVPYGAFLKRKKKVRKDYTFIFNKKTKYVAWIVSNCSPESRRWEFVQRLKRYIKVDIYGRCGNFSCNSNQNENACFNMLKDYKFYLSFENSLCKEYVTKKLFDYINRDIIPIVRGGADYYKMFPPGVFIDTRHFGSIERLGKYLNVLSKDEKQYTAYLRQINNYEIKGMGYGYQNAFCKHCRNLNDRSKYARVYRNISNWLYDNPAHACYVPNDLK